MLVVAVMVVDWAMMTVDAKGLWLDARWAVLSGSAKVGKRAGNISIILDLLA